MGLKEWIIPQDKAFFDILEKESANVLFGATRLEDAMKSFDDMEERRKQFKEIEHIGDDIVHQIYEKVNRSFITPSTKKTSQNSPLSMTTCSTTCTPSLTRSCSMKSRDRLKR